ncbi:MAG: Xaa-Pro aminopeptidase [Pseudonocardiales bacterium]|nr:MAG: Xaa-Pro aminopeptidase [Pseudonocardiales bacterium]
MIKSDGFSDTHIEQFRRWQRVSFEVLGDVADQLVPGMTERDATRLAVRTFAREGARRYFHPPVALFGQRTALPEPWTTEDFYPTDYELRDGDAIIMDASPIFDGFVVDTSISRAVGPQPGHARLMADNLTYRDRVLAAVRAGATCREIALDVDHDLTARGYQNRHGKHPEAVLGHQVVQLRDSGTLPDTPIEPFDAVVLGWFIKGIASAHTDGSMPPTWNDQPLCNHRAASGLWAVEPHIALGGTGVKWEELLVVDGRDAYWLDDQVPHLTGAPAAG